MIGEIPDTEIQNDLPDQDPDEATNDAGGDASANPDDGSDGDE